MLLWHVFTYMKRIAFGQRHTVLLEDICIYMYTFATFAFSDMCIEIIILGYKDLEFDFPLKGQLKCGMFYLLQDVCNCNYISE